MLYVVTSGDAVAPRFIARYTSTARTCSLPCMHELMSALYAAVPGVSPAMRMSTISEMARFPISLTRTHENVIRL
eukprot:CAMPEP_0206223834 /NCGR_PEP_ID=MMETSP0047_2-20121206/6700_1 /ASSEMBLY_ACC=CAM_ASM_000192 /TAXON_ID=195065 /ORGANISM="Chroomonas mesostigmatica_cf, Strain CCMP1168" /LENGTH=74 /DNA_ID=CAMNT_0053646743 /DNA_START=218 /DNA_END=442 /DNA_ORIENTATION=+